MTVKVGLVRASLKPEVGMVRVARAAIGNLLKHTEHIGGGKHHAGHDADHHDHEGRVGEGELETTAHDQKLPDEAVRAWKGQGRKREYSCEHSEDRHGLADAGSLLQVARV